MDIFTFGDIVLLPFPFSGGGFLKKRPALVVKNTSDYDFVVCRITSQSYFSEYDVKIDNWGKCGLKSPSIIRVHKLATIEKDPTIKLIGKIDELTKEKVKMAFHNILK